MRRNIARRARKAGRVSADSERSSERLRLKGSRDVTAAEEEKRTMGRIKKKCARAGVTLSRPAARQASASPRSRVSQDSSHIRPGKLKSPSFRKGGGIRKLRRARQKGNS